MNHPSQCRTGAASVDQRSWPSTWQWALIFFIVFNPITSQAAAPFYFDLLFLMWSVIFYFLGFVLIPLIRAFRKSAKAKSTWGWIYFAYIVTPIGLFWVNWVYHETKHWMARHEQQVMSTPLTLKDQKISKSCQICERQRATIHELVTELGGASVSIHLSEGIQLGKSEFMNTFLHVTSAIRQFNCVKRSTCTWSK